VASENASTFENNDVGRNVALYVLLKAMLASEAQVVFRILAPRIAFADRRSFCPPFSAY